MEKIKRKNSNSKIIMLIFILIFSSLISISVIAMRNKCPAGCGAGGGGGGAGNGNATVPLSEFEKQALNQAILEEYLAKELYKKAMSDLGIFDPMYWISRQESGHINMLANLHTKYGLPIPANTWSGNINIEFESIKHACEVGAQAEIDNALFYRTKLQGIEHDDMELTFIKLGDVSEYSHLPAFQNCAK